MFVVLGKFPLIARLAGPGPLMVTLLVISNSPPVRAIVPVTPVTSMKSPFDALASAVRRDPGPVSAVLVTVMVAALTTIEPAHSRVRTSAAK